MNYLELYALKVSQPLCDFYLTAIKAVDLKQISFSEQLQYKDEKGQLKGSQRKIDTRRLSEIGKYIDSVEMSFPNSIIIAANYDEDGKLIDDEEIRWDTKLISENLYKIIIPSDSKLAAVIDGQHRLNGFDDKYLTKKDRYNIELPVAVFFDLSNPYQAFLFATINGNQKRVDKSLALEQFGFNVEEEPQHTWTPEKLAVYFVRKLNFKESPLNGHIKIAPKISKDVKNDLLKEKDWSISTATIVDGIINLISSNAKRDRVEMAQENIWGKRTRKMVEQFKSDKSPLRLEYLEKKDDELFEIILNFLKAAKETILKEYNPKSYIFKTVGFQALFDLLNRYLIKYRQTSIEDFKVLLESANIYDFTSSSIQASGIGRGDIRNALLLSSGLINLKDLKEDQLKKINEIRKDGKLD